ncbi:MAG: MFS transporter, partial [Actinomycetota bacterium]|nr:MFS transporter [Actinomycetota bacterium]
HPTVVVAGLATMAAGLLVAAMAVSLHSLSLAVTGLAVAGAGEGLAIPSGIELIMTSVPPEQAGSAAGVHETIVEAGGALGIAVLGSTLAGGAGYAIPLVVGTAALVVAGLVIQRTGGATP